MAHRSPARWLAPLALAVFVIALIVVIGGGSPEGSDRGNDTAPPAATAVDGEQQGRDQNRRRRKTYVVKLGDTPSQIAAETGVSLDQLEKLNPDLDPQLLAPGEKIRIRP